VKEIAQQTGFEDEHYFCRFFKMKTGLTPGKWRSRSLPDSVFVANNPIVGSGRSGD